MMKRVEDREGLLPFAVCRRDCSAALPKQDGGWVTVLLRGAINISFIGARKAALMNTKETSSSDPALARLPGLLPEMEVLYIDVHAHPELSMQETRTVGLASERLRAVG